MQKNKTIFFVHGMMCGAWCFEKYKKFFEARGYRCIVPTLRYHGDEYIEKPHPNLGSTSLRDYVDDVAGEIAALNLSAEEKPIIVGHSMGGIITQMLAARGLAHTIVTVSSAPPAGIIPISRTGIRSFFGMRSLRGWQFWRRAIYMTKAGAVYAALHLTPINEQEVVLKKFGFESGRAAFEIGLPFLDKQKTTRIAAKNITCPMLVIAAAEDRILPPVVQKKIARKYGADYKEFPHHAHWIVAEPRWEEVAEYIDEWLSEKK